MGGLLLLALPAGAQAQRLPEGVKAERNIEYVKGGHERNKLDLYLPEKADAPLPVVVWIHGGAWRAGSKDRCPMVPLTAKGYAVASINYRFLEHGEFPAQIEDCKAAIRWLRANAKMYNLDAAHIGVIGASAGGHLAALLGTAADVKELEGNGGNLDQPSKVQAVVDLFGPVRIPGRNAADGYVIKHVNKDNPPFLIVHGEDDTTVPIRQSEQLNEALKKAGVEVTFVPVKGAGHGGPSFTNAEAQARYLEFFDKHLKKPAPKKD
jgi:acetyl esterase/lipase